MTNVRPGMEVVWLAREAHVADKDLATMVAIAFRESRWDADAIGYNPPRRGTPESWDLGLWQINSPTKNLTLLDPKLNALAMSQKYRDHGLEPWTFGTTHGPSTYRKYLPAARDAIAKADAVGNVDNAAGAAVKDALGSVTGLFEGPFAAITGALFAFVKFLTSPETWIRLGEVLAGGALVLVGIWFLASGTDTGAAAKETGAKAAKAAAIA